MEKSSAISIARRPRRSSSLLNDVISSLLVGNLPASVYRKGRESERCSTVYVRNTPIAITSANNPAQLHPPTSCSARALLLARTHVVMVHVESMDLRKYSHTFIPHIRIRTHTYARTRIPKPYRRRDDNDDDGRTSRRSVFRNDEENTNMPSIGCRCQHLLPDSTPSYYGVVEKCHGCRSSTPVPP